MSNVASWINKDIIFIIINKLKFFNKAKNMFLYLQLN